MTKTNSIAFQFVSTALSLVLVFGIFAPLAAHADGDYEGATFDSGYEGDQFFQGSDQQPIDEQPIEEQPIDQGYEGNQFMDQGYEGDQFMNQGYDQNYDQGFQQQMGMGQQSFSAPSFSGFSSGSGFSQPSFPRQQVVYQQPQIIYQQQPAPRPVVYQNSGSATANATAIATVTNINNVQQQQPQYPVQYIQQPPQYIQPAPVYPNYPIYPTTPVYPTYQNAYCTIYASPASITNGAASYLTWTSSGGTTATLSDGIGNVAVNGSLAVRPNTTRTYVLTIWGYNGQTASCNVTVSVTSAAPYVSLSQIPYTGFDFGTFGNALYWFALLAFALSAAYLMIYYQGGAMQFAAAFMGAKNTRDARQEIAAPVALPRVKIAQMAPVVRAAAVAPKPVATEVVEMRLPIATNNRTTTDTMQVSPVVKGEMPRLVITRA